MSSPTSTASGLDTKKPTITPDSGSGVAPVDVATLREWLENGECVLVDVREPFERASERIEGSVSEPLSGFDPARIDCPPATSEKRFVFQCRTGRRSGEAAERFFASRGGQVFNLTGGLEAWRAAGCQTVRTPGAPKIDVMRQVQIAAGGLVLTGVLLGAFVSPWFLILSGFVGGGLMFAGLSGWCGMAKFLGLMPWNRAGA